ncbi:MAG: tetratricopeptide repeat protein [Candidatus Omnitrophica bacterium]|nr:tetratricopeptide repeat protein [Candidatus Omnitrophota bacterium]
MRKIQCGILILMLTGTLGCSREYQSERSLHKAIRLSKDILATPDAVPPSQFNKAIEAYTFVFERYPDTLIGRKARMLMGSLYVAKKEYAKSREVFKKTLELYPDDKAIAVEARFSIGKSYELEGLWPSALAEYTEIIRKYPDTPAAFDLPIYIARYYEKQKDIPARNAAYLKAIKHYIAQAEKYPNTDMGFLSESLIVTCYMNQEDWGAALEALEKLLADYPMAKTVVATLRTAADISVRQLKDPQRAVDIFNRFMEKNPKHPLNESIKKGLEAFKNVPTNKN